MSEIHSKIDVRSSETKITEETRRLTVLKDSLSRSNALTSGMASTLENFDKKLKSIDELITPMYASINETQLLLQNVDESSVLIDKVLDHYAFLDELDKVVSQGPGGQVLEYLNSLESIELSMSYFQSVSASTEMKKLSECYNQAKEILFEESKKIIDRYGNPLMPKDLTELYMKPDAFRLQEVYATQKIEMENLRKIVFWLIDRRSAENLTNFLIEKRATFIRRSLERLTESLAEKVVSRRHSMNPAMLTASLATGTNSLSEKNKRHEKKSSDSSRHSLRASFNGSSIQKGIINTTLVPSPLIEETEFDLTDKTSVENYIELLKAFLFLLTRERDFLAEIFPSSSSNAIFSKIVEQTLQHVVRETTKLRQAIDRSIRKLDTAMLAINAVFLILQWFSEAESKFSPLIDKTTSKTPMGPYSVISDPFEQLAIDRFRAILDDIRTDTSPISDGGHVHPLTSHVIVFIETLLKYRPIVTRIIAIYSQQNGSQNIPVPSKALTGEQKVIYYLAVFIVQLINAWFENISRKTDKQTARQDTVLRTIFLLTNVNFLLKRLEESSAMDVIILCEPNMRADFVKKQEKHFKDFTNQFAQLSDAIQRMEDYDNNHHIPASKLNDRDRDKIKEAFTNVNAAIESIQTQCQKYIVVDLDIRQQLHEQTKTTVMALYKKFYDKYSVKDFAKHRDKYVRYDLDKLKAALDKFF